MMENTQAIVEFARDKIDQMIDRFENSPPDQRYDEQVIGGMISITKHMLDTAVKLEAWDTLRNLSDNDRIDNADVIRDIFEAILNA